MKRTPPKLSKFWRVAAPTDLFVQEQRAAKLDGFVGKLTAIDELVDFAAIATAVEAACPAPDRSRGGRPPYATEVMVRLLFLQALYGLSDEESEYQILGRRGFHCFCRLEGELHLPDARTLWRFKQRLAAGGLGGGAIFEAVSQQLQRHGFIPRGGQIIDASIVQAPTTQTRRRERQALDAGEAPEDWSAKRLAHTDRDARWGAKHGRSYYGCKLHGNVDVRYKLIRRVLVALVNVGGGQVLTGDNTGARIMAGRSYDSAANRRVLEERGQCDGIARRLMSASRALTAALDYSDRL